MNKPSINVLQFAEAILESFKIMENSFDPIKYEKDGIGYRKTDEEVIEEAFRNNNIHQDFAYILYLTYQWGNDLQDWAEAIIFKYGRDNG